MHSTFDLPRTYKIASSELTKMVVVDVSIIAASRKSIPGLDAYFLCDDGQKVDFHRVVLYRKSHVVHDLMQDCRHEDVLAINVEFPSSVVEKCVDALYGEDVEYTYPMYDFFKFLDVAEDYLYEFNYFDTNQVEVHDEDFVTLTAKVEYCVNTLLNLDTQSCNFELRDKIRKEMMIFIKDNLAVSFGSASTISLVDKEFLMGEFDSATAMFIVQFVPRQEREVLLDMIKRTYTGRLLPEDI